MAVKTGARKNSLPGAFAVPNRHIHEDAALRHAKKCAALFDECGAALTI
jgi:hypothetical protein